MRLVPAPVLLLLRRLLISVETFGVRGALVRSYRRLCRSLSNNGLTGTLDRAFHKAPVSPAIEGPRPPDPFDLLHGTDTSSKTSFENLPAVSVSALYITVHFAISPSTLNQALSNLPFQPRNFTFVDLGCGKGRALFVASQFPFRRFLGVELVTDLCDVARANIATNPDWASRISVLNEDATTVTLPDGPLLIFLYCPFMAPVLRRVLANLERQLRRSPRETYLLYAENPRYDKVLKRFPFLRELSENSYPVSPEDVEADEFHCTQRSFTLYAADLTR